ncbi:MAG: hypothetical protein GY938_25760 [Ketobacter sp.]|nr:hypothetical protein [Ketobacter sp.]
MIKPFSNEELELIAKLERDEDFIKFEEILIRTGAELAKSSLVMEGAPMYRYQGGSSLLIELIERLKGCAVAIKAINERADEKRRKRFPSELTR